MDDSLVTYLIDSNDSGTRKTITKYGKIYTLYAGFHPITTTLSPTTNLVVINSIIKASSPSVAFLTRNNFDQLPFSIDIVNATSTTANIRVNNVYMKNISVTSNDFIIFGIWFVI